jgi:hypothetical protein
MEMYALGRTYWKFQKAESIMSEPILNEILRGLEQQFCDKGGNVHFKEKSSEL